MEKGWLKPFYDVQQTVLDSTALLKRTHPPTVALPGQEGVEPRIGICCGQGLVANPFQGPEQSIAYRPIRGCQNLLRRHVQQCECEVGSHAVPGRRGDLLAGRLLQKLGRAISDARCQPREDRLTVDRFGTGHRNKEPRGDLIQTGEDRCGPSRHGMITAADVTVFGSH